MHMEAESKDARQEHWKRLRSESEKTYKPSVKITTVKMNERVELQALVARLEGITIEIAAIGSKGIDGRARVFRGNTETGRELYDTGECRRDTMESRLTKFLAQQQYVEAMMVAR